VDKKSGFPDWSNVRMPGSHSTLTHPSVKPLFGEIPLGVCYREVGTGIKQD